MAENTSCNEFNYSTLYKAHIHCFAMLGESMYDIPYDEAVRISMFGAYGKKKCKIISISEV
jgi:hypothetical protein